jgi:NADPH:quinone reductase-like Zn-dependent oxidoreductase
VPDHNVVAVSDEADVLQLAMIGVNPLTALLLLRLHEHLSPGDWIAQTGANSAVGQYVVKLAKLAGVKTLNLVRRETAAAQVAARSFSETDPIRGRAAVTMPLNPRA